ncbi:MAG TPA: hypothetical protein VJ739_19310 [Gemmataceae bacterium]|nr:hypothetical protein [Gemmataceae bacterium]
MTARFGVLRVRSPRRFFCLAAIALVAGAALYLQRPSRKPGVGPTVPTAGTVLVDGEPLEEGSVIFIPDPARGNTSPFIGRAQVLNGSYQLATEGKRGVPPGWYKVIVLLPLDSAGMLHPPPRLFDRRFSDPDRTPLSVEVLPSGANEPHVLRLPTP